MDCHDILDAMNKFGCLKFGPTVMCNDVTLIAIRTDKWINYANNVLCTFSFARTATANVTTK